MNAPLGDPSGCKFFMPDPWSFDEKAYPADLNDLLALPRYAATNYLEMDRKKALLSKLRLIRFFAPPSHWTLLAEFSARTAPALASTRPSVHTFSTLFDYLSVLSFSRLRRTTRAQATRQSRVVRLSTNALSDASERPSGLARRCFPRCRGPKRLSSRLPARSVRAIRYL
jgi:hypothetical protein